MYVESILCLLLCHRILARPGGVGVGGGDTLFLVASASASSSPASPSLFV